MGGYAYIPMPKDIYWIETAQRNTLAGRIRVRSFDGVNEFSTGLSEGDMDPIQQWCEEHHCGRRTSFDTFRFKNKKQITMFLLRWG
jgi:hypothetical protein